MMLIDVLAQLSSVDKSLNLVMELEAIFGLMTEVPMIFAVSP